MIQYCTRCLLPDTKPDLGFDDEGVCNACTNFALRPDIDWTERADQLESILERYRSKDGSHWDCIIPVSGGKDSTFQVIKMLELGMTPLCVTSTTCHLSEIGRENIENIKRLGVDYMEFSPNPNVRSKLNRIGLEQVGDISWPEHVGIFTIPVNAAVRYNIPLIIWGENSQHEYGGPAAAVESNTLDRRWLEEFGGMLGMRVSDLVGQNDLELRHLIPYIYPSNEDLQTAGVTGLFLGYFLPWDGYSNALLAQAYGFKSLPHTVEGSIVDYENLDNLQTGIHDYFKFLKFGFGRASDIASLHIRRGRITRNQGLDLVKRHDGQFPWTYLDIPLEDILDKIDMTVEEFTKICDKFTNKKIFEKDARGQLVKDRKGNLTKVNYDNI